MTALLERISNRYELQHLGHTVQDPVHQRVYVRNTSGGLDLGFWVRVESHYLLPCDAENYTGAIFVHQDGLQDCHMPWTLKARVHMRQVHQSTRDNSPSPFHFFEKSLHNPNQSPVKKGSQIVRNPILEGVHVNPLEDTCSYGFRE